MPRRKKIVEEIVEEEAEEYWDIKKLIIGLTLVSTLAAFIFYVISTVVLVPQPQGSSVLSEQTKAIEKPPPPEINIPSEEDVDGIINGVRDSISQITAHNFTASQSAINKMITDLQKLKIGDRTAQDYICDVVCKKE